jgi:20S proteasome alpha/beta subunit
MATLPKPHPKPNQPRLPRRNRVTLIAAFRCSAVGVDGNDVHTHTPAVVICADSQETYGNYRVAVDKIKPRDAGAYDLIIGGAGNTAALIDGLANTIERHVKQWPSSLDEESARQPIENVLIRYHARQVTHYPAQLDEKELRFIICTRDKQTSQIYLWKTDGTTAEQVGDYALLGWEETLYDYEVRWLYYPGLHIAQAVVLGAHLLTVAKNGLYIGGETQVVIVTGNGMTVESSSDIQAFEQRIRTFNRALARLMLACPDVGIEPDEFREVLTHLEQEIVDLHSYYSTDATLSYLRGFLVDSSHGHGEPYKKPYKKLPFSLIARCCDAEIARRAMLPENPQSDPKTSED